MLSRSAFVGLFLAFGAPQTALAEDGCFCLLNPATLKVAHRGCEAVQIPNRLSELVTCQTQDYRGTETVSEQGKYSRIQAGNGDCNPCRSSPISAVDDGVRQPDSGKVEEETEKSETTEKTSAENTESEDGATNE